LHTESNRTKKKIEDYKPLPYRIPFLNLELDLSPEDTRVCARYELHPNPFASETPFLLDTDGCDIFLDGVQLNLESISFNDKLLKPEEYSLVPGGLLLPKAWKGQRVKLEIITHISPASNTELIGLYQSSGIYCTQNEPEGFRRITFYPDRPDVLSVYRVRIETRENLEYLLSNGNRIGSGYTETGKQFALWEDPFPKPCYLFALVAGNLEKLEDTFVTCTGRRIQLEIYTNRGKSEYAKFAMESLKLAMRWDEEVFHREYDLDLYMIVAVDDFNMGAMENKGLNLFNSKLVLASPETVTDSIFEDILSVVAHEYFHNWSGNRVTLRDWFQLTLKEGLTVFRDQLFSQDMIGSVKRIDDVDFLRTYQFPEDQGKLAHPIQPREYLDIDNFYTRTVYEKGAEVIRMIYTITSRKGFVEAMDEYFRRYDGKAVTTDDFLDVFESLGYDLSVFRNWYLRKGTPRILIQEKYVPEESLYTITWEDENFKDTKIPLHYPVLYTLHDTGERKILQKGIFHWKGRSGEERFVGLNGSRPVLSLFQEFSSPVEWEWHRPVSDLLYLWRYDPDPFTRQDSSFQVKLAMIDRLMGENTPEAESVSIDSILDCYTFLLESLPQDWQELRLLAYLIRIPSLVAVTNLQPMYRLEGTHSAILSLKASICSGLQKDWLKVYKLAGSRIEKSLGNRLEASGIRYFRNEVLEFLNEEDLLVHQFRTSQNMTDTVASLKVLSHSGFPSYDTCLKEFASKWKDNPLVMDYWLSIQGGSSVTDCFERVKELKNSDYFDIRNPNRIFALLGSFTRNRLRFHDFSGETYRWIAEIILELDGINSQSASRLAKSFSDLGKLPDANQKHAREALSMIRSRKNISNLVYEVVDSILS